MTEPSSELPHDRSVGGSGQGAGVSRVGEGHVNWDERYASVDQVWSGQPNAALVSEIGPLAPGGALDVGCGEGADAIWLAGEAGK